MTNHSGREELPGSVADGIESDREVDKPMILENPRDWEEFDT